MISDSRVYNTLQGIATTLNLTSLIFLWTRRYASRVECWFFIKIKKWWNKTANHKSPYSLNQSQTSLQYDVMSLTSIFSTSTEAITAVSVTTSITWWWVVVASGALRLISDNNKGGYTSARDASLCGDCTYIVSSIALLYIVNNQSSLILWVASW